MSFDRTLSLKNLPAIFTLVGLAGAATLLAGNAPAQPANDGPKPAAAPQPVDGGTRQPVRGPGGPGGPGGGNSVDGAMKQMNGALKALKESVDKTDQKEQNLMLVATMERACLTAKSAKPTNLKGDPKGDPKDAAKTLEEYQRTQIKLMGMLLELETQVLDGKTDAAKESIKKLGEFEDSSHQTFQQKRVRGR